MLLTIRLFYLLVFIAIASQGIFYFIAAGKALQLISLQAFMEQRKAIESIIEMPLRVLYYSAILLSITMLVWQIKQYHSVLFITVAISFAFLLGDVFLALTKSVPLNVLIRSYTFYSNQEVYEAIRVQWLFYIKIRGSLAISGLLILIAGFVYECKMK